MTEKVISQEIHDDTKNAANPFLEWYYSSTIDMIYKASLVTLLFFSSFPWAAFFWPPYYFIGRKEK